MLRYGAALLLLCLLLAQLVICAEDYYKVIQYNITCCHQHQPC